MGIPGAGMPGFFGGGGSAEGAARSIEPLSRSEQPVASARTTIHTRAHVVDPRHGDRASDLPGLSEDRDR
jgi:hypothetical protein